MIPPETVGVVVAALGGAAVGLERQWSGHAEGPSARFAGIRTFTLLGIVAGLSGWLIAAGLVPAATVLLAGAVAITVAAYAAASRQDVDGTTEVAALVVLAAGVVAGWTIEFGWRRDAQLRRAGSRHTHAAVAGDRIRETAAGLAPPLAQYRGLRTMLARYRALTGPDVSDTMPPIGVLHPGASGPEPHPNFIGVLC